MGGGEVMESGQQRKRGPRSLAPGMRTQCRGRAETSEGRGKREKGIRAEAMGKFWGRSADDEEGQTRMDSVTGVLMWKEFVTSETIIRDGGSRDQGEGGGDPRGRGRS